MRLDPIEETFIVCRVVKACWGKIELKIEAVSEHALSEEGTIFLTTDPNYEIVIPEEEMEGTISVILEMKRIEDVQLEKYLLEGKK